MKYINNIRSNHSVHWKSEVNTDIHLFTNKILPKISFLERIWYWKYATTTERVEQNEF